jgi:hypothetical protein
LKIISPSPLFIKTGNENQSAKNKTDEEIKGVGKYGITTSFMDVNSMYLNEMGLKKAI